MSNYGQGSTRNWRRIRQQVLERDFYECQVRLPGCTFTATEVDHKLGVAAAGVARGSIEDELDLCRAVCSPCHVQLTARQRIVGQRAGRALREQRLHPQARHPGEM